MKKSLFVLAASCLLTNLSPAHGFVGFMDENEYICPPIDIADLQYDLDMTEKDVAGRIQLAQSQVNVTVNSFRSVVLKLAFANKLLNKGTTQGIDRAEYDRLYAKYIKPVEGAIEETRSIDYQVKSELDDA